MSHILGPALPSIFFLCQFYKLNIPTIKCWGVLQIANDLIQCGCLVKSHPNKFGESTPNDLKVGIFPVLNLRLHLDHQISGNAVTPNFRPRCDQDFTIPTCDEVMRGITSRRLLLLVEKVTIDLRPRS